MSTDKIDIKGLDLKIDQGVHTLCEEYNSSSGSTRSVLYFLLLINVLSLIAVINSHRNNWTNNRLDSLYNEIQDLYTQKQSVRDSNERRKIEDRLILTKRVREYNIKNKIEKYQNVQVPILGNSFDINNLGIVSGITFIILLVILRFTLTREKNNLRIALESISERYIDGTIEKEFADDYKRFSGNTTEVINQINKTRRKHHYNFLSMNEIFNLPLLEVSDNALQNTFFGRLVNRNLFYFPYFIYLAIFVNDLSTVKSGMETSPWHTLISTTISYLCLWVISYLCKYCNLQKRIVNSLFTIFYSSDYKYHKIEEKFKRDRIVERLLYPFYPLYKVAVSIVHLLGKKKADASNI